MFWKTNNVAVHASFAIALDVAKAKKAHTIGETLLKPCIQWSPFNRASVYRETRFLEQFQMTRNGSYLFLLY